MVLCYIGDFRSDKMAGTLGPHGNADRRKTVRPLTYFAKLK